ncbi:OmpA family protein [Persicobacter sp. CCB-QB2]|uniref:OmpA family protein n=1 Tax=Persicobacter sp. CCB-QB2 TaxID=1561025 RepID=UPI00092F38A9|nr:OmpA family protein [Persicobacter sp. CCB-QB2]
MLQPKQCFLLLFAWAIMAGGAMAQSVSSLESKAEKLFRTRQYEEAIGIYQQAVEKGSENPKTFYGLGMSYFSLADVNQRVKGAESLQKALDLDAGRFPKWTYLNLAKLYHLNEQIPQAEKALAAYEQVMDRRDPKAVQEVQAFKKALKNAKKYIGKPRKIAVHDFGFQVNSEHVEYNPVVSADEAIIAYTVLHPDEKGREMVEQIMMTTKDGMGNWKHPEKVEIETNARFNVGTAGISPDGEQMLIYMGGASNTGDIYEVLRTESGWTKPKAMNMVNTSRFHETTLSITSDGKTIYFASDRPGGYGGMDIWKVEKGQNGKWGQPKNLGPKINSPANEDAPFIHPDNITLFFTSDGHETMGGNDIFRSVLRGKEWTKPENMGYPINTPADDSYFTLIADGSKGYFSSNRKGGQGLQDIYYFDMPEQEANIPLTMLKGKIVGEDGKPIKTSIKMVNRKTQESVDFVYDPNPNTGNFLIILPPGQNYDMIIESEGFMPYTINVNIPNQTYFYELYQMIQLKSIKQFGVLVGQEVSVKNKFYDVEQEVNSMIDQKLFKESQLVQNDSLDMYEMMDLIVASEDEVAMDYLLDLAFKVKPVDLINFDQETEKMEVAKRRYFFDESTTEHLERKVVDGQEIFTLPTLSVAEESKKQKAQKAQPKVLQSTFEASLLNKQHQVFFQVGSSEMEDKYKPELQSLLEDLMKYEDLGIEISGHASQDGDAATNEKLSNERAIEVLNFFNHKGVVRRRIKAKGYGVIQDEQVSKEQARRVDIRLVDLKTYEN